MDNKLKTFVRTQLDGKYGEFLRYALVGAVTTTINFSVYYMLYGLFKVGIPLSNGIAVVCANVYSYFGNKQHVFRSHCGSRMALYKEITLFFASRIGSMAIETLGVPAVIKLTQEPPMLAKIEVVAFVVVLNYIVSKFVVFHVKASSDGKK